MKRVKNILSIVLSLLFLAYLLPFSLTPSVSAQEADWDSESEESGESEEKAPAKKEKKEEKKEEKKSDKKEKKDKKSDKKEKKTKLDGKKAKKSDKGKKEKKKRKSRIRRQGIGTSDEYMFKGKTYKVADYVKDMMVKVPAGEFVMGSPVGEKGRNRDERQHKVKISQDFYIGKYEVTQDFYLSVMGRRFYTPVYRGESRPMENITWRQALGMCRMLNKLNIAPEGYFFFLPTEAQWEYAARGGAKGEKTIYAGSNKLDDVAIYAANGGDFTSDSDEVGTKKPNSLGIYDMSGSVAEWCFDWYAPYPNRKDPLVDPWGPRQRKYAPFTRKILRGGHWNSTASDCRVASRVAYPSGAGLRCGIRLVLIKPPAKKAQKTPPAPAKNAKPAQSTKK